MERGETGLRRAAFQTDRCLDRAGAGAGGFADVDWRLVGGGGAAGGEVWHRLGGGGGEAGGGWAGERGRRAGVVRVTATTRPAGGGAGRHIDEDHYGAALAYRFGGPDDPGV